MAYDEFPKEQPQQQPQQHIGNENEVGNGVHANGTSVPKGRKFDDVWHRKSELSEILAATVRTCLFINRISLQTFSSSLKLGAGT